MYFVSSKRRVLKYVWARYLLHLAQTVGAAVLLYSCYKLASKLHSEQRKARFISPVALQDAYATL
jgi:hypothetical protein